MSSKFDKVFQGISKASTPLVKEIIVEQTHAIEQQPANSARRRRSGKSKDPDYQQVTIYIPRALHDKVKIALIQEHKKEFSQLVEEVLNGWISDKE